MTNSSEVAKTVARKCSGGHRYVHLVGGRAKKAQFYSRAFSRTVCDGIAAEKRNHALGLKYNPIMSVDAMETAVKKLTGEKGPAGLLHESDVAFDDQSEAELDSALLREARKSEIAYFNDMGVYC